MKADLHVHSNCSDGSDNPENIPEIMKHAGVDIFALTDHDTTEGCKLLEGKADFIKGIELTATCENIKCHILGYDIDINNTKLISLIEKGKKLRRQKLETRIKYLRQVHNFEFTQEELIWLYSRKSVVKTHLANILVKRGLAANNIEAMKKYLDKCKTGNTRFNGKEAIHAITAAGGIPVWAHPLGGEGEKHLCAKDFFPNLKTMIRFGIRGLECHYSRYTPEEINFLIKCANDNNLLISGGSDYHGTNKDIPPGKLNTENIPIDCAMLTVCSAISD